MSNHVYTHCSEVTLSPQKNLLIGLCGRAQTQWKAAGKDQEVKTTHVTMTTFLISSRLTYRDNKQFIRVTAELVVWKGKQSHTQATESTQPDFCLLVRCFYLFLFFYSWFTLPMAVCYVLYSSINSFQCFRCQNDWKWEQHSIPKDGLKTGILSFSSLLLVTFDLSSSTFEELKMAWGALEAAAVARRNLQHARVHQAVLICTALLATHAMIESGPKTKSRDSVVARTVQLGHWVHFTPPSPWKPSLNRARRVTASPATLESRVHLRPGSRVGTQKETFFLSAMTKAKKTPSAVILQLTALSHMEAVWKSYQQKWIVWIRRLCASLRVCF